MFMFDFFSLFFSSLGVSLLSALRIPALAFLYPSDFLVTLGFKLFRCPVPEVAAASLYGSPPREPPPQGATIASHRRRNVSAAVTSRRPPKL